MKAPRSNRRALRIVSQCATAEEFVAAFHPYLDRDALFIATGSPEEPGQAIRFVLTLAGGETVLRGAGRVVESHRDRANFYGLRGMKLRFEELDDSSRRALGALEARATGPNRAAGARPGDVIECLVYDDPETESADPASTTGNRRGPPPSPQHAMPLEDDDVTAVSASPPRPPSAPGAEPPRRQTGRTSRASGAAPVQSAPPHATTQPPPVGPATARDPMSFIVPRPRTEIDGAAPEAGVPRAPGEASELATDRPPSMRPRGSGTGPQTTPPQPPAPPPARGAAYPASPIDPRMTPPTGPNIAAFAPGEAARGEYGNGEYGPGYASGEYRRTDLGDRPMREGRGDYTPGDFPISPSRSGIRGVPRPPMQAERTEIVRIRRPSSLRAAAIGAFVGIAVGVGAGYVVWGLDYFGLREPGHDPAPAPARVVEPPAEPPAASPSERPAPAVSSPAAATDAGTR